MTDLAAATRLAVYGTLAPGQPNHHQLAALAGHWRPGIVRGHLQTGGWAAAMGYKALVLDPAGPALLVQVFESDDLPAHWARLDAFEGAEYRRVVTMVERRDAAPGEAGTVEACIYVFAETPDKLGVRKP